MLNRLQTYYQKFKHLSRTQKISLLFLLFILLLTPIVLIGASTRKNTRSRAEQPATPVTPSNLAFGKSAYLANHVAFDKKWITIGKSPLAVLKSNFTVEFWVKMSEKINGQDPTLFQAGPDLRIFIDPGPQGTNKTLTMRLVGNLATTITGPELNVGQWYHVAASFSPTNGTTGIGSLAVNGRTIVKNGMDFIDSGNSIEVGGYFFTGEIDEVRISNIVRYPRSGSPFVVPSAPFRNDSYTYLLLHLDGNVSDSSSIHNLPYGNNPIEFRDSSVPSINQSPVITTTRLSQTLSNNSYMASVVGLDYDIGDLLSFQILDLPTGLSQIVCPSSVIPPVNPEYTAIVSCISGKVPVANKYTVRIVLTDNHGGQTTKVLPLQVLNSPPVISTSLLPVYFAATKNTITIGGYDFDSNDSLYISYSAPWVSGMQPMICTTSVTVTTYKYVSCSFETPATLVPGQYPLKIVITDNKDSAETDYQVTLIPIPPSISPTPTIAKILPSPTPTSVPKPTLTPLLPTPTSKPTPTYTPYPTPTISPGSPFTLILSNPNTEITCVKGDLNCYYSGTIRAINRLNFRLFDVIVYTTNPSGLPNLVTYIGPNGNWTTGQTLFPQPHIVEPGTEGLSTAFKVTPPQTVGKYFGYLYVGAKQCSNPDLYPNTCFYGESAGVTIIINVVQ